MRKRNFLTSFILLGALATPALAQQESLLIGSGDLIQVDVLDTPEMEQQVRVTDDGTVPLAYVGNIRVAGQTPANAAGMIQRALIEKKVMQHPEVTVRIQEYATQDVSVLGQVRTPGTYPITTPQPILKVLSLAGGLVDAADRHITVKRQSGEQLTYYVSNDSDQALAHEVLVHPGDTILVARAPMVYVMGDVNRPGGYAIATNDARLSVMQVIAMAGSANKTSMPSHVRLIRKAGDGHPVEMPVRLDAIEKGKREDVMLQANDIVYVPFSWMKNIAMNSASIAASTAGAAVYVVH
jgi:polysaccharide export outer membrane protein